MNTILLQVPLAFSELDQLRKEFPHYRFLVLNRAEIDKLSPEAWSHVEVIYGSYLTSTQLAYATELRWIYIPHRHIEELPLEDIKKRDNIIVTVADEENSLQISEFVMGLVLSYAKGIPHWCKKEPFPICLSERCDDSWREHVWSLPQRVFLQVGLGKVGSDIVKHARQMGLTVNGVMAHQGFHADCDQIFDYGHLPEAVAKADIVCVYLPMDEEQPNLFGLKELGAMKQDSILIIIGPHSVVNVEALTEIARGNKWRGLWLDVRCADEIAADSPLWQVPGIVISPDVASLPGMAGKQAFQLFHVNLRQYVVGNFSDMHNVLHLR